MPPGDEYGSVERAKRDPEAVRELYDLYFPRLYAYAVYRVGNAHDAEDLVSEVFLRVLEGLRAFEWRHEGSFAAWLFRVAHNLVADSYRRRERWGEVIALEDLPDLAASSLLPDDAVLRKEKFSYLRGLIGELPPRQQEVVTLRFFGGLRNKEIARVLGLEERTVAAHLCRGLEGLHGKYVEDFGQAKEARGTADERA
jgi:RNA polymerase sigma-70 factor (ECF subfamily)